MSGTRSSSPVRSRRSCGCRSGSPISFLYLGGVGLWPGVLVGDLLVNDYSALPIGSAVGQTFGNLLEVLVATLLMRRSNEPVAYLVFPTLIWAALRFGERGATLAITIAVGCAVWNTTHNEGPFAVRSITHSVLATQLYLAVAALSTLFLVAVVTEREAFARRLATSRSRLVEATETERRRLGRNLHDGAQQRLTALVVRLGLAAEDARRVPEQGAPLLEEAGAEVTLAIEELRQIAHGIHPVALNLGLAAAIKSVADRSSVPFVSRSTSRRHSSAAGASARNPSIEIATSARARTASPRGGEWGPFGAARVERRSYPVLTGEDRRSTAGHRRAIATADAVTAATSFPSMRPSGACTAGGASGRLRGRARLRRDG